MSRVRSSVDRASVSGTEGRGFESLRAHQQRFHTIGMEPFFVVYLRFEGVIRDAPDIYLRFEGLVAKYKRYGNRMIPARIRSEYSAYRVLATP
jgi:hypothetical protein